ncbi:VOC family protein [Mesorhizobium sp. PL10]
MIDHITIELSDLDKSKLFYEKVIQSTGKKPPLRL